MTDKFGTCSSCQPTKEKLEAREVVFYSTVGISMIPSLQFNTIYDMLKDPNTKV